MVGYYLLPINISKGIKLIEIENKNFSKKKEPAGQGI